LPTINFTDCNGIHHAIEVDNTTSLMEAAFDEGLPGMAAECGGACSCATCHVYVDPEWYDKLDPVDELEDYMLDVAYERKDNSRLACQIVMTDELDGIELEIADND